MNIPVTIAKSSRFQAESTVDFAARRISMRLVGLLNEEAELDVIHEYLAKSQPDADELSFDLEALKGFNSSGLKAWLVFIGEVEQLYRLRFTRISEVFVAQANLLPNLLRKKNLVSVDSFFAPYFCETCRTRTIKLLEIAGFTPENIRTGIVEPPPFFCGSCKRKLLFDEIPKDYFGFLARQG